MREPDREIGEPDRETGAPARVLDKGVVTKP